MENPTVLKEYDSDFEILIPHNLKLERNSPKSKEVAQKIKKYYFGDQPVSQEALCQYVDVSMEITRQSRLQYTCNMRNSSMGADCMGI
jgi:hypothetical protein